MRDFAIAYLKEQNKNTQGEIITRLYYNDGGDYVEDLSFYANPNYMSDGLLNAIKNGQSLTIKQQEELKRFTIEKKIELQDISGKYTVEKCKSITLDEKGLFINAESVNFVPCKIKWGSTSEVDSVTSLLDRKWAEVKELINESNKNNITQNITINIENVNKDVDINKFTKAFAETLKRQQGIR